MDTVTPATQPDLDQDKAYPHPNDPGEHAHPPQNQPPTPNDPPCPPPPERPPTGTITPPKRRTRCQPKRRNDCCKQIAEILNGLPGNGQRRIRKPKRSASSKLHCLCDSLPVADAILPLLYHLLERFRANQPAANPFEKQVFDYLGTLSPAELDALTTPQAAFAALPPALRHCLFAPGSVDRPMSTPVTSTEFIDAILKEGLASVTDTLYPRSGGMSGPGIARLFERVVWSPPPDSKKPERRALAPWPMISAVRPIAGEDKEYRNMAHLPSLTDVQPHEFAQKCTYKSNPAKPSEIIGECVPVRPAMGPSGFMEFCEGGSDYTVTGASGEQVCLQIPDSAGGTTVVLRGFNFISEKCRVRLHHEDSPMSVFLEVPARTIGDFVTPLLDASGAVIADGRVHDFVEFELPKDETSRPFPPGIYDVTVMVPNVLGIAIEGSIPADFVSNRMLLRVHPDPDILYRVFSDEGFCEEETDGVGSDEIWFDAYVAAIDPAKMLTEGPKLAAQMAFDRGAWDDMDSGEAAGSFSVDFHNGKFPRGGVVAVGLMGLEVDSEDAAKEQIRSYGGAFLLYLEKVWAAALATEGIVATLAKIASLTLTQAIWALVVVAVVILVIGLFWAGWAPADPIAQDMFVLSAAAAFDLTNVKTPLGPETARQMNEIHVTHRPRDKVALPLSAAAVYTEEHRYRSEDEDSTYRLMIRHKRG